MVNVLNCIEDSFISTDYLGGSRTYVSPTPILLKDNFYRFTLYRYGGNHLKNVHIDGRNSDNDEWKIIQTLTTPRTDNFKCPDNFTQIRIFWNKSESETNVEIGYWVRPEFCDHRFAYISDDGDDSNNGTLEFPYKTICKALSMGPKTILLRRGDTFYESIAIDGIDLKAYGVGEKPKLSGLKILKSIYWERGTLIGGLWEEDSSGFIWRISLCLPNECYSGFCTNGSSMLNNIGGMVNLNSNELVECKRVKSLTELFTQSTQNFDFYQPVASPMSDTTKDYFDYLYVFYDGDLRALDLGVSVGTTGITAKNCTIEDITVEFWGRHGVSGGSYLTIENCIVQNIGGMIMLNYSSWVCLGNGIEFYVKTPYTQHCLVENCVIKHCYDAGLTVQGTDSNNSIRAIDIKFRYNSIYNCCQSFEEFLRGSTEDDLFYDCVFEANNSFDPGMRTGFRYNTSRYKRSHLLGNSTLRRTQMVYRNNYFYNGNFLCSGAYEGLFDQAIWENNVCYIAPGQDLLGNYNGTFRIPVPFPNSENFEAEWNEAIENYRRYTGDQTSQFFVLTD